MSTDGEGGIKVASLQAIRPAHIVGRNTRMHGNGKLKEVEDVLFVRSHSFTSGK